MKFKEAKADFKHVCKIKPQDRDARSKLKACEKEIKKKAFEDAIMSEEEKKQSEIFKESIDDMLVPPSYVGPKIDNAEVRPPDPSLNLP